MVQTSDTKGGVTRVFPTAADCVEIALLLTLWLPAWLLPQRTWPLIGRCLACLLIAARFANMRKRRKTIARGLQAVATRRSAWSVQRDLVSTVFERYLLLLRERAPWGWSPEIRVEGLEHVERGLAANRGVLLFIHPTSFYTIVGKKGLAGAGVKPVHLSRPGHGFSDSAFGIRHINPLLTRIEDRYISRRLVLNDGAPGRSLRPLLQALGENHVVTITATAEGRTHRVPFLGGSLRLARGAASIALASGAVLLPMITVRDGQRYRVVIGAPLQSSPSGGDRDSDERRILEQYAARLQPLLAQHPEQFPEWHNPNRWQPPPNA
jgi:lauroyl/myristoyl acyltransferase